MQQSTLHVYTKTLGERSVGNLVLQQKKRKTCGCVVCRRLKDQKCSGEARNGSAAQSMVGEEQLQHQILVQTLLTPVKATQLQSGSLGLLWMDRLKPLAVCIKEIIAGW